MYLRNRVASLFGAYCWKRLLSFILGTVFGAFVTFFAELLFINQGVFRIIGILPAKTCFDTFGITVDKDGKQNTPSPHEFCLTQNRWSDWELINNNLAAGEHDGIYTITEVISTGCMPIEFTYKERRPTFESTGRMKIQNGAVTGQFSYQQNKSVEVEGTIHGIVRTRHASIFQCCGNE